MLWKSVNIYIKRNTCLTLHNIIDTLQKNWYHKSKSLKFLGFKREPFSCF